MPGYLTKEESIAIRGVANLKIRSLLDHQQYSDPLGEAERLGISSASWPLFGLLWPSGAQLAACLAARPVTASERILEIGCGLGLASLVGHRRGADITASDCHPLAATFLAENLKLNQLAPMNYRHGHWGAEAGAGDVGGEFDLIIGSDLLYERDAKAGLASFLDRHIAPAGEIWIVDPDRGNRPAFNAQMAERGFERREESLNRPASATSPAYKGRLLVYWRAAAA